MLDSSIQLSYLKLGAQSDLDTGAFQRYGDYFGAALDPSNSSKIWVAGEYYTISPMFGLLS